MQRMFLEKIPLNKKRSGKKEKTQPLHLETTKPLPSLMSIKKQPLIEKVLHLKRNTSPFPFQRGRKKNPFGMDVASPPPFPSPPIEKSPFEKEKKRKLPTLCSFHKTPHITSNFINSIYFYSWPLIFTQTSIPQKNPFKKGKKFNSSTSFQKYSL